jgi:chemotaxis protein CheC
VTYPFSDLQLDAMRELGNVGSGTAATALSSMIGVPVDIDIAQARLLPIDQVVSARSEPGLTVVLLPIVGDLEALVMILMGPGTAETVCELLGVPVGDAIGDSALSEVGNILGASYVRALGTMIGAELEPQPPELVRDVLDHLLASSLLAAGEDEVALLIESTLTVDRRECSPSFLFIPSAGGLTRIFDRLGVSP